MKLNEQDARNLKAEELAMALKRAGVKTERREGNKYEIVETIDGEFMILIHGVQWGPIRDRSGAGDATFKTRKDARMQLAHFYMEDRRIAEGK